MESEPSDQRVISDHVQELSLLRTHGEITEDEYQMLLSRVLDQPAGAVPEARARVSWEYCEPEIELPNVKDRRDNYGIANAAIVQFLKKAGEDGWEINGPSDVQTLWRHGCVTFRGLWGDRYKSATLRLRRPWCSWR